MRKKRAPWRECEREMRKRSASEKNGSFSGGEKGGGGKEMGRGQKTSPQNGVMGCKYAVLGLGLGIKRKLYPVNIFQRKMKKGRTRIAKEKRERFSGVGE